MQKTIYKELAQAFLKSEGFPEDVIETAEDVEINGNEIKMRVKMKSDCSDWRYVYGSTKSINIEE